MGVGCGLTILCDGVRAGYARDMSTDHRIDEAKGRVKEAAGDLTDNQDLKDEGKVDRATGKVKEGLEKVEDAIEGAADKVKDAVRRD